MQHTLEPMGSQTGDRQEVNGSVTPLSNVVNDKLTVASADAGLSLITFVLITRHRGAA